MTTKATGYEFKKFLGDDGYWYSDSKETYYDDPEISVNGEPYDSDYLEGVKDTDVIGIHSGVVVFDDTKTVSLEAFFRKWKKMQSTASFIVECDNSKKEKIVEAIKELGGKIK